MASLRKAEKFEPADFSIEELEFLSEHLGETANVALHEMDEDGVNPKQIRPFLNRLSELEELKTHRDVPWAGYDAIKKSIAAFLDWHNQSLDIQKDGGPRHPSQFGYDEDDTIIRGQVGADSSDKVRSRILDNGERETFTVMLREVNGGGSPNMPWLNRNKGAAPDAKPTATTRRASTNAARRGDDKAITHDKKRGLFLCNICDEAICTYDKKKGVRAVNAAKAKVDKHLRTTRDKAPRHRAALRSGKW